MDYIREELLRQQAALAALLLGAETVQNTQADSVPKQEDQEDREAPQSSVPWSRSQSWPYQAAGIEMEADDRMAGAWTRKHTQSESGINSELSERTGTETVAVNSAVKDQTNGREISVDFTENLSKKWEMGLNSSKMDFAAFESDSQVVRSSQTVEILWPSQGDQKSGVRDFSLALERDARRYDGGFSLY